MTQFGGPDHVGNIFSVGIDGSDYQDLHDFNYTDWAYPQGDLTLSGGTLFGMTSGGGGASNAGTIVALVIPEPGTLCLRGLPLRFCQQRTAGGGGGPGGKSDGRPDLQHTLGRGTSDRATL